MSRIQKLENHYQEQLTEHKVKDVSVFIQNVINADITKGKYARFLIESFLNNKFLKEDLVGGLDSTVGQAISLFDKHKGKLPIEQRSVYALDKETGEALYQSPGDLWNVVKQFQGKLSGKELKKEEQEQIYRETEFIHKDEKTGFQIISPLTKESAQWWGKGTRWCTSADNNNMFNDYAKDAPLFILLMPNGDKLQVWKYKDDIQFMDESDNDVDIDYIEQYWTILEPICLWLNDIKYIPKKHLTEDRCKKLSKTDEYFITSIPEQFITKEMCELAVQQNGVALLYIPDKYKTFEMYKLAVQKYGDSLTYVPKELRTQELCELAMKNDGCALQFFANELRTEELCEIAIKNNGKALQYVPEELKTYKLCKLAVTQAGSALYFIPKELITKEICELAVNQDGLALEYIPEQLRTQELCELAVRQNVYAFLHLHQVNKTLEMCKYVIEKDEWLLRFCPKDLNSKLKKHLENYKKTYIYPQNEYKKIFNELRELFPNNTLSLDIK